MNVELVLLEHFVDDGEYLELADELFPQVATRRIAVADVLHKTGTGLAAVSQVAESKAGDLTDLLVIPSYIVFGPLVWKKQEWRMGATSYSTKVRGVPRERTDGVRIIDVRGNR